MEYLVKELKKLLMDNVVDIIIFGSVAKGKLNNNDIDIAVLEKGVNKKEFRERLDKLKLKNVDVQFLSIEDYNKFIWVTLIREGFSIKQNKYLAEIYRIKPMVLYKYSLKTLTNSKKVMFERAIKNFKGIEKLSNSVVLVPIKLTSDFNEFLKIWNIDFDAKEYGLMPLVRKES